MKSVQVYILDTISQKASEADSSADDLQGGLHVKKRQGGKGSDSDTGGGGGEEDTIPGSKGPRSTKRDIESYSGDHKGDDGGGGGGKGKLAFLPSSKAIVFRSDGVHPASSLVIEAADT